MGEAWGFQAIGWFRENSSTCASLEVGVCSLQTLLFITRVAPSFVVINFDVNLKRARQDLDFSQVMKDKVNFQADSTSFCLSH